jgi:hypothetical protein
VPSVIEHRVDAASAMHGMTEGDLAGAGGCLLGGCVWCGLSVRQVSIWQGGWVAGKGWAGWEAAVQVLHFARLSAKCCISLCPPTRVLHSSLPCFACRPGDHCAVGWNR